MHVILCDPIVVVITLLPQFVLDMLCCLGYL